MRKTRVPQGVGRHLKGCLSQKPQRDVEGGPRAVTWPHVEGVSTQQEELKEDSEAPA